MRTIGLYVSGATKPKRQTMTFRVVLLTLGGSHPAWAGPVHEDVDVVVGRSIEGQLLVEYSMKPAPLPPVAGLLEGWALDDPGFLSLPIDEPEKGIFTLGAGAIIALEVIAFDPALQAWTPGFASTISNPGDAWTIGGHEFDEHPTWHINSQDPAFDLNQTQWQAVFRLVDHGTTAYLPSDPIMLSFTPVPEPASLILIFSGTAVLSHALKERGGRKSGRGVTL